MFKKRALSLFLLSSVSLSAFAGSDAQSKPEVDGIDPMQKRVSQALTLANAATCEVPSTDIRRSLVVTEVEALAHFDFRDVLTQLVSQGPEPSQDPAEMFRDWSLDHACDAGQTEKTFNDFEFPCRPQTAEDLDPFGEESERNGYFPVGVFNRFDLAPASGQTCGEYRMVFARRSGLTDGNERRFIIFEGVLPNPQPEEGLSACQPVAEFWADLSSEDDVSARGLAVRDFFMNGLPGFAPVVHIDHYGLSAQRGSGQIRTNNFLSQEWHLAEFRTDTLCEGSDCRLQITRATAKDTPAPALFGTVTDHALTEEFQQNVVLAAALDPSHPIHSDNVNLLRFSVEDRFHAGDSNSTAVNPLSSPFFRSQISGFTNRLDAQISGSPLSASQIIQRIETQACGGCHGLQTGKDIGNGVTFPQSLGFTHTSEFTEDGPEGLSHRISPALVDVFLPFRKQVMDAYLSQQLCETSLGSFEQLSDWSVANATATIDPLSTEGQGSLRVSHTGGSVQITSREFIASDEFGSSPSSLSLDLFVPEQQPNPWFFGNFSARLTCPEAQVWNGFLGSSGLTLLPRDQFSTQSFSFPSWIANALASSPEAACTLEVVLFVTDGAGDYQLDNLQVSN